MQNLVTRTGSTLAVLGMFLLYLAGCSAVEREPVPAPEMPGSYRTADGAAVGIDRFITDEGQATMLFSNYSTRVVRRLYRLSDSLHQVGSGFAKERPVTLQVQALRDATQNITALQLQTPGGAAVTAERVPLRETAVRIPSGGVELAGTLIVPASRGPHPAIVLLHGSGPLTRHSFGPYPHFFASLGFAVLIYDKRGTGESPGELFDSSVSPLSSLPDERFPERLISDAQAVVNFLRQQAEIDPAQIGLWGSSEGGMLTTQVAAADPRIAFAINSSGFMGPLWETSVYQAGLSLRKRGWTEEQIQQIKAATRQWVETARTGRGFEELMAFRRRALAENKGWLVGWTPLQAGTLEQLRWHWDHVMSFDPRGALAKVRCPVLSLYGELDTSTDVSAAASATRAVLSQADHPDFTVKVIPGAGHSLMDESEDGYMARGVFETLAFWLGERVKFAR
jgi:pimeloyl-ACP methyl ester carboxylesterase